MAVREIVSAMLATASEVSTAASLLNGLIKILSQQEAKLDRIESKIDEGLAKHWRTGAQLVKKANGAEGDQRKRYLNEAITELTHASVIRNDENPILPIQARFLSGVCHHLLEEHRNTAETLRDTYDATTLFEKPPAKAVGELLKSYAEYKQTQSKYEVEKEARGRHIVAQQELLKTLKEKSSDDLWELARSWQKNSPKALELFLESPPWPREAEAGVPPKDLTPPMLGTSLTPKRTRFASFDEIVSEIRGRPDFRLVQSVKSWRENTTPRLLTVALDHSTELFRPGRTFVDRVRLQSRGPAPIFWSGANETLEVHRGAELFPPTVPQPPPIDPKRLRARDKRILWARWIKRGDEEERINERAREIQTLRAEVLRFLSKSI